MTEARVGRDRPRQETPTRGAIVLERATLKSYAILASAVSAHVFVQATPERTAILLRRIADITRGRAWVPVDLARIRTVASVESISSTPAGTRVLLHSPRDLRIIQELFHLTGRQIRVAIGVPAQLAEAAVEDGADLASMLSRAADRLGMPEPDLLERLTTFRNRDGRVIPGRRALAEVTAAQRPVVADRLRRILQPPQHETHTTAPGRHPAGPTGPDEPGVSPGAA